MGGEGDGVKTPSNLRGSHHSQPQQSEFTSDQVIGARDNATQIERDAVTVPATEIEFSLDVSGTVVTTGTPSLVEQVVPNMTANESELNLEANMMNISAWGNSSGVKLQRRKFCLGRY